MAAPEEAAAISHPHDAALEARYEPETATRHAARLAVLVHEGDGLAHGRRLQDRGM